MTERSTSAWQIRGLILLTAIIVTIVAFLITGDYGREVDFLNYRLALNLNQGNGFVYNAGQQALLTLSPLAVIPFSLAPHDGQTLSTVLFLVGLGFTSITLYLFLSKYFSPLECALMVCLICLSYPTWVGMRSLESIAFAGIVLALILQEHQQPIYSALVTGVATLVHPTALIGVAIVGIFGLEKQGRYWVIALLPMSIWLLLALLSYGFDGLIALTLHPTPPDAQWLDWLWLIVFVGAIFNMTRTQLDRRLFIFPLWASIELGFSVLFSGTFSQLDSIAVSATITIGIITLRPNLRFFAVAIATGLLIIAPPQTPKIIEEDHLLASELNIPENVSILHNRTAALGYYLPDFEGEVYHFDGRYQPETTEFTARGDIQSLVVATAPDYIFVHAEELPIDLSNQNLIALDYAPVNEHLFARNASIGTFPDETTPVEIAYSQDVLLTGYALDRTRVNDEETLRLRLDWKLNRFPDEGIGVNINLNDLNGTPITSIFTQFPRETWQTGELSTYHALRLPAEVDAGLLQVQVTLDYRAGILDRHTFGGVIVPIEQPETVENLAGTLGSVNVYAPDVSTEDGQLRIDLVWQTTAPLNESYRIFVHVTPTDSLEPLAQDDGLPLGGRYPTNYWLPDELVPETRTVDISALPAGDYHINLGLYTPETGRLRNEEADYLRLATLNITEDGIVTIRMD